MKSLLYLLLTIILFSFTYSSDGYAPHSEEGIASYYSDYYNGKTTASGEIFDQSKLTAAHKTLPFGSVVTVVNLRTSKEVEVIINDRGPFVEGRIIDLSFTAASRVDMIEKGIDKVRIVVQSD